MKYTARSCFRGSSGVLPNQEGHGKRIPHRRTSLTNLATDETKTGGKERRSLECNTSSTTSTRAGRPESQRRTTDQLDSGSRHGMQEKPRASPSDTVTSGGLAGRAAEIAVGRSAHGVSAERQVEDIHHIGSEKPCASEPDLKNGNVRRRAASPRAVAEKSSWVSKLSSMRRG
ncbi:hypothetical protein pipiens_006112 [Culex pipiens pipiens]|uniref:Uncharacterized protein n=1 Tax=Culex pipiens pipiens TaxID=38569 RepID=A0ABD1DRL5_CULPP